MVRLMLTLTPCVCILSAIAFSKLFELYLKEEDVVNGNAKKSTPGKCINKIQFITVWGYNPLV
jgi:dolichyl-diphosphooligosaccharide--protein glycosyltransferase